MLCHSVITYFCPRTTQTSHHEKSWKLIIKIEPMLLLTYFPFQAKNPWYLEQLFMMRYGFPILPSWAPGCHCSYKEDIMDIFCLIFSAQWFLGAALPIQPLQFCDSHGGCHLLHPTPLAMVDWIRMGIGPTLGEKASPHSPDSTYLGPPVPLLGLKFSPSYLLQLHALWGGRLKEASQLP